MAAIAPQLEPAFPQDWEIWRDTVTQLYQKEGKTLEQVRSEIEQKYKVLSTPKMLKNRIRKWKIDKKNKRRDMKAIVRITATHHAAGKADPRFRIRGKIVTVEHARNYFKKCGRQPSQSPNPNTPSDVSVVSEEEAIPTPKSPETPIAGTRTPTSGSGTPISPIQTPRTTSPDRAPRLSLTNTPSTPEVFRAPEHAFYSANNYLNSTFTFPNEAATRRRLRIPVAPRELITAAAIEYASAMDAAAFGRYADARIMLDACMNKFVRSLRAGQPQVLSRITRMLCHAEVYETQDLATWTMAVQRHVCHLCATVLGPTHPITIIARTLFQSPVRLHIQEALLQQTLAAIQETMGDDHGPTLEVVALICRNLISRGRLGDAVALMQQTVQNIKRANPRHAQVVLESLYQLGWHQRQAGQIHAAIETMTEMRQAATDVTSLAGIDIRIRGGHITGRMLRSQGRYSECAPMFERLLTESEELLGAEHEQTVDLATDVAQELQRTGHPVEAENLLARFPSVSEVPV